jgi:ubiquitin-like 1-activating enzyme E1 B
MVTLGEIVDGILGDGEGADDGTGKREVSVYEDKRILSDPDWDDNYERTLESLNVTRGKFLMIVDEDGEWGTIAVGLGVLPWVVSMALTCRLADLKQIYSPNHPVDAPPFVLPCPLPLPPRKARLSTPSPATLKRSAPDDDEILEVGPSNKRAKTNGTTTVDITSPSKKRRLDEDGLILMESANDKLEDDVIEID